MTPSTESPFLFLIAEDEDGNYEPIELVATIDEAEEVFRFDMKRRLRALHNDEDPGLCPFVYKLFMRQAGRYQFVFATFPHRPADGWVPAKEATR